MSSPATPPAPPARARYWATWFFGGLALWLATVVVTYRTGNSNLVPTIVLLGSFLVPASFVVWAHERYGADIGTDRITACFAAGGLMGVLGASLLEYYLLSDSVWVYAGVGLIEEAVKAWALVMLTRRIPASGLRHGLVLGATVGFGFAAFETAGYAFNAVLTEQGLSLRDLVSTEILRGVLAPVGHGLWTAILGGVLFRERRNNRFVLTPTVLLTYLGVSALHALWDSSHGIAAWIVSRVTEPGRNRPALDLGFLPHPTENQVWLFTVLSTTALALVAWVGLLWLLWLVRSARRAGHPTGPQPPYDPARPPTPPGWGGPPRRLPPPGR
ncbi:PrsW family intramembrane metalloprotease [Streptacidiphilus sp. PB12-B1b]|uniref:PrsW family intramembrane metalloprotease n=1 Tax=Streptacidiphilus sp. PB12-B1b TaxID=2705012 RepID=UPI0015FBDD94|nr:PrsW family glutamic-type intramembrane protease [Streptacidiphilus sp. PB12-B1b]QMU75458.1 PrsW family intramembrane metalloprotease [Streptacidiphilus sp. PB12-B1b]